jgi:BlaI family transcriptional regulator, penicillinase repressor
MTRPHSGLTRRETQVMDAVYELEEATAKEVRERLPNAPSYSAVRAVLTRLVEQGLLKYREAGPRYVYSLAAGKGRARQAALRKLIDTFFDGSAVRTMNALIGMSARQLSDDELKQLADAIAAAREKER